MGSSAIRRECGDVRDQTRDVQTLRRLQGTGARRRGRRTQGSPVAGGEEWGGIRPQPSKPEGRYGERARTSLFSSSLRRSCTFAVIEPAPAGSALVNGRV